MGCSHRQGIEIHCNVHDLVYSIAGLANSLLQSTVNRHPDFRVTLFTSHIRQILDHCSHIWNVGFMSDLALLESVQRG